MTRDPETIQKAIDTLEQAIELELKKIDTMRELRRALMIMKIAPNIFDMGKVSIRAEGGMTYTSLGDCPSSKSKFVIVPSAGGEEVSVPLFEVPLELWPEHMLKAFRMYRRSTYKTLAGETDDQSAA